MVNDNEYPESIDLGTVLGNFLWKIKENNYYFDSYFYLYKSSIKTFLN